MKQFLKPLIIILSLSPAFALACEKPQVTGYDEVDCLQEGFASVKQHGKYGFVNKVGKVMIPIQYDDAQHFSEGFAGVKQNGQYGFINKGDEILIPAQYDRILQGFKNGKAQVKRHGEQFYIDKEGKRLD